MKPIRMILGDVKSLIINVHQCGYKNEIITIFIGLVKSCGNVFPRQSKKEVVADK